MLISVLSMASTTKYYTSHQCSLAWKAIQVPFEREIFPQYFLPSLYQHGLVTEDEWNEMQHWCVDFVPKFELEKGNTCLFELLAGKLESRPSLMDTVLWLFRSDGWYEELAEELADCLRRFQLRLLGSLPSPLLYVIKNSRLEKRIFEQLKSMSQKGKVGNNNGIHCNSLSHSLSFRIWILACIAWNAR